MLVSRLEGCWQMVPYWQRIKESVYGEERVGLAEYPLDVCRKTVDTRVSEKRRREKMDAASEYITKTKGS